MNETFNIGALVTVALFLLGHLGLAIWFASRMNTKVGTITDSVKEMTSDLKEMAKMNTRITVLEQRMERAEQDAREALKAVALVASEKRK